MKKLLVSVVALAMAFAVTSCGKDDVTAPEITLPSDELVIDLGDDEAAFKNVTAKDDKDGDVTNSLTVEGLDYVGKGTLTYYAKDNAGNVGKEEKNVTIKADKLFGGYAVVEKCEEDGVTQTYDVQVAKSGVSQTELLMNNFYGYDNVRFIGDGKSTTLTMEKFNATADGEKFEITGSATYKKGTSQYEIVTATFKVTWEDTDFGVDNYTMTFRLQ